MFESQIRESSRNEGCVQPVETLPAKKKKKTGKKEKEEEEPVIVMGTFFRSQEEPARVRGLTGRITQSAACNVGLHDERRVSR